MTVHLVFLIEITLHFIDFFLYPLNAIYYFKAKPPLHLF